MYVARQCRDTCLIIPDCRRDVTYVGSGFVTETPLGSAFDRCLPPILYSSLSSHYSKPPLVSGNCYTVRHR